MQRTTAVSVGLLFLFGVALVLLMGRERSTPAKTADAPRASAVVAASAAPSASVAPIATEAPNAEDAGIPSAFDTLPDGRQVPELPTNAPKAVSFGVVLVTYQGAQGAPSDARTKAQAEARAQALLAEAKRDFAAAVGQGDRGSSSNLGRMERGILEPAVEYLLFTLQKGSIHPDPIDTPRGFWIVRRND